jgi:haloalkane dehalogenase
MKRRDFVGLTAGVVTAGALSGRAPGVWPQTSASDGLDAAAYRATRKLVETSFGKIAYVERGVGDAAFFVHGFPLNGFQWRGAIERLAGVRRCIAIDLMGLGYSEIPTSQRIAPATQVEMLAMLLDQLAIARADFVGNDSGGAMCQLFAAKHPERVRSLLLTNCDTQIECPAPSFLPIVRLAKAGTYADRALVPAIADHALVRSARGMGGLAYLNPANPSDEAIDYYFAPLVSSAQRKTQFHEFAISIGENFLADTAAALERVTAPVRIVWGAADTVFSISSAAWLDRTFPHSRGVRRVAGAKLFFPEEMPDLIAEEARALWRS